jgi:DNA-binding MarR family transcriptional regulator
MAREMEQLYAELFEAAGVGRRFGEGLAARQGQTQARWQTMWTIAQEPGLTVPRIARRLGVTRQSVQRVVDELMADELAVSMPNPDHRTSPIIELTSTGQAVLDDINRAADVAHRRMLKSFGPAEVAELRRLLAALTAATPTDEVD